MKFDQIRLSNISTDCLIRTLLRHLWMILAAAMIGAMSVSLYLNLAYKPLYQATMTYAVTARRTSYTTSNNISATREVSGVLTQMLKSSMVYEGIRGFSPELTDFSGTVTGQQVGESNMIVVAAQAETAQEAFLSILALRELFPEIVGYVSSDAVVQGIRNPAVSTTPANPVDAGSAASTAALLGGGAMALLLCWLSISRETVQTRSGARNLLDADILVTISRVRRKLSLNAPKKTRSEPLQVFSPTTSFAYTEQINTVCARMEKEAASQGRKVFLVTGVGENEGKSTVAANVAAALAMMGKKVALLDCDLRNPSLHSFFDKRYNGSLPLNKLLSQPLTGESLMKCMVRHEQLGLYMLFALTPDRRCTELLAGQTMGQLLSQLRIFDYVILDTPPMGYFADTETLLDAVDASMLIVRQDHTPAADINEACDLLRSARSHFMGVVLNDMTASLTEGSHYGYGYGYGSYGYGYGYGSSKKSTSKKRS